MCRVQLKQQQQQPQQQQPQQPAGQHSTALKACAAEYGSVGHA